MADLMFKDYIEKYININQEEWVEIYKRNKTINRKNDIFTFSAMIDLNAITDRNYLKNESWGFSIDSFGKVVFGIQNFGQTEKIVYFDGATYDDFEYLVALRSFEKYGESVEINPKLIWYGNLAKKGNTYFDPITDEDILKFSHYQIKIKRKYLKDFLAAEKKACTIVFDHRRFFHLSEKELERHEKKQRVFSGDNYYFSFLKTVSYEVPEGFNAFSILLGKTLIMPFKQPHHKYYKFLTDDKKFERFIIGFNEEEDKNIEFTCDENQLSSYFHMISDIPHFLTPVFFKATVLNKYINDPRNYTIDDDQIRFLGEWTLPFSRNNNNTVSAWLGDLGKMPYEEQQYWKSFNIIPTGQMEEKFFKRQVGGEWTDASRIETKLFSSIRCFNKIMQEKYGDVMFSVLRDADKEIYNSFVIPTNCSMPEYQSFLLKLTKLTAENINIELIKKVMAIDYTKAVSSLGSTGQLGAFLKHEKLDMEEKLATAIKKAYNSRNKLAAHKGSYKEYNKLWGRSDSYKFNSIEDARNLIKKIVTAFEYIIGNYEAKKP